MRHLFRFEEFSPMERTDEILDKINKHGINSLTDLELEFLNSISSSDKEDVYNLHRKLIYRDSDNIFISDDNNFRFEYKYKHDYDDYVVINGIFYFDNYENETGDKTPIEVEGSFNVDKNTHNINYNIYYNGEPCEIYEFAQGNEYELDSFIDYIITEIENI